MKLSLIETNQEKKKYAFVARFVSTLIRALNLAPKRLFKMHFRRFRLSFHLFFSSRFCFASRWHAFSFVAATTHRPASISRRVPKRENG